MTFFEASQKSTRGRAIRIDIIEHEGRTWKADIVKGYWGDAKVYYHDTLMEIPRAKVSSSDIDRWTDWRPY